MAKLPTAELLEQVQILLPTNHNREISAADVRSVFDDVIDTLTQENVDFVTASPYTVLDASRGNFLLVNRAPATQIDLPQPGVGGEFVAGWSADFLTLGAGAVTITPQGGALINGGASLVLGIGQSAEIACDGTNYWAAISSSSGVAGSTACITLIIDAGSSPISAGIKGDLEIPFNCTITQATLLADQAGSLVLDIWKDTFANYPPTVADSITAAAKPTITASNKSQDSTLTGWTTVIAAGDTLRFNVDSAATIRRVTLSLRILR